MVQNNQIANKNMVRKNEQIRTPRVLLIKEGKNLGTYPTNEAIRMAREEGLDLVEVSSNSNPPVCSIMDYGKFVFDQQRKKKLQKQSQQKEKEINFRYVIDEHDLTIKANQIKKLIEKGYKVKVVVKFKARENAHRDKGFTAIKKCLDLIQDVGVPEKAPTLEGNNIICRVDAKKG